MGDWERVRQYVTEGSQDAFGQLVREHLPMVYAAAMREVRDEHLAEDVGQAVFLVLARRAESLKPPLRLAGWLFRVTTYAAASARAKEKRRHHHEQRAGKQRPAMQPERIEEVWDDIEPKLNTALAKLGATDREAVILRYLEERSVKEVAEALGVSEAAAKMRIGRGLEKLRGLLGGQEGMVSVAGLAAVLETKAMVAVPAGLAGSVTAGVVSGATAATGQAFLFAKGAMNMMAWAKIKVIVAVAAALLVGSTAGVVGLSRTQAAATKPATAPTTQLGAEQQLVAAVYDAMQANLQRMKTWRGQAIVTYQRVKKEPEGRTADVPRSEERIDFLVDNGRQMIRSDTRKHEAIMLLHKDGTTTKEYEGEILTKSLWDGQKFYTVRLYPGQQNPPRAANGQPSRPRSGMGLLFDPVAQFISPRDRDMSAFLKGWSSPTLDINKIRSAWDIRREGDRVVLEAKGNKSINRYTFDLSKAGNLVIYEAESQPIATTQPITQVMHELVQIDYQQQDGVVYPVTIRIQYRYHTHGDTPADGESTWETRFENCQINGPVEERELSAEALSPLRKIAKLRLYPGEENSAAVLVTDEWGRSFPIVIGQREGKLLAPWLEGKLLPPRFEGQPTLEGDDLYTALVTGLRPYGVYLIGLRLSEIENHTFRASIEVRKPTHVSEYIDCRPSDGMNLVLRTGAGYRMTVDEALVAAESFKHEDGTPMTEAEAVQHMQRARTVDPRASKPTDLALNPVRFGTLDEADRRDLEKVADVGRLTPIKEVAVDLAPAAGNLSLQLEGIGQDKPIAWPLSEWEAEIAVQAWQSRSAATVPASATAPTLAHLCAAETFCAVMRVAAIRIESVILFHDKSDHRAAIVVLTDGQRRTTVRINAFDGLCIALSGRGPLLMADRGDGRS